MEGGREGGRGGRGGRGGVREGERDCVLIRYSIMNQKQNTFVLYIHAYLRIVLFNYQINAMQ